MRIAKYVLMHTNGCTNVGTWTLDDVRRSLHGVSPSADEVGGAAKCAVGSGGPRGRRMANQRIRAAPGTLLTPVAGGTAVAVLPPLSPSVVRHNSSGAVATGAAGRLVRMSGLRAAPMPDTAGIPGY